MTNNETNKPKVSLFTIASAFCLILFLGSILPWSNALFSRFNEKTQAFSACILLIASILFAIAALLHISFSDKTIFGKSHAFVAILIAIIPLLIISTYPPMVTYISKRVVCGTNLKGLPTAFAVYAMENDDNLPTAESWCDLLIAHADVSPKSFICPTSDAVVFESSYALNKHVVGMKFSEIPEDIVLLFETETGREDSSRQDTLKSRGTLEKYPTIAEIYGDEGYKVYKDRFNQVGGPEIMNIEAHPHSVNVALAGGQSIVVKHENLPSLRWDIEGKIKAKPKLPVEEKRTPIIKEKFLRIAGAIILVILSSLGAIWLLRKFNESARRSDVVVMGVLSTAVGAFFGFLAEAAYGWSMLSHAGAWSGAFFGLLVGICYIPIISATLEKVKNKKHLGTFLAASGMVTGIICSTLVHAAMLLLYGSTKAYGMIVGVPYGTVAGLILGLITAGIFKSRLKATKPAPTGGQ